MWYLGNGRVKRGEGPVSLPTSLLEQHQDPAGYLADEGLVDAVNVALQLGQPLLLTGQPGTGKTQLAYSLAWELGFERPFKFETKSTSIARDLFYTYDALGRFHAAQTDEGSGNTLDYIRFNALGRAILFANDPQNVKDLIPPSAHGGRRRSVVLIDEIDKAPRDFPNDLLNEVEDRYFKIPELGNLHIKAEAAFRPVLVLTSNSEKNLPEAFLRRCVFYHLPFPNRDRLTRIVSARLGEAITGNRDLLNDALEIFDELRKPTTGLVKKPSTGEFLGWLRLVSGSANGAGVLRDPSAIERALCSLVKTVDDRDRARKVLEAWRKSPNA